MVAIAAIVVREWIALRRYCARRDSVERLVAGLAPGSRITDRDTDGAVLDAARSPATQRKHSSRGRSAA